MFTLRNYENLAELDYEDSENKRIVSIEMFGIKVLQEINGVPYLYNDYLIGAIDCVSHKYQIKCKENYKEVFDFMSKKLRELGW